MPDIDVTKLDQRIKDALLAIQEGIEREDEYLRLQQLRQFKKNNLFWHGFQYLFWSDIDSDWKIPTQKEFAEVSSREDTKYIFDYVVNIFKAHGESIIAALSADIPDVKFGPRNAHDPNDMRAVEAADNAVELIEKWNRAKLLIINALFYLSTEGFVASYTYNKKDSDFGSVNIPQYGKQTQKTSSDTHNCDNCGYSEESQEDSLQGMGGDPEQNVQPANKPCPECQSPMSMQPGLEEDVPVLTGNRLIPKGREIVEVYGPLSVRVSAQATKQADTGFLIHYVDNDPAAFKDAFPDFADEIDSSDDQGYERIMRQSSLSMEGYQLTVKQATQKKCWFRPWTVQRLGDAFDDIKDEIKKMFPVGIYFSSIGKTICEARTESMDKHWTLTKAGPSKGLHADPLLQSIVPLQEIHNNLTNLFVMQVEYGVPATYADSEVYDFDGQSRQEVVPGYVYPVTPRPGQSIADAFYTEKTTTLSKEATQLLEFLQTSEQFCSGSFPSIYGGPSTSGSKTLGEYDKSRAFALQRLSLVWYYINVWYGETMHKALQSFIEHQVEDEPNTSSPKPGQWQTKWVRAADLKGSFDRLEPDASSDFPVSFSQKRSTLMALAQLNNPEINSVLYSPENAAFVQSCVGLTDLVIPMDNQRTKQMREILILIGMAPQEDGQGNIMATVPVEPDIDDHEIHIEILRNFLVSDAGQDLKEFNSQGYANCLAHLIEHKQAMMPPGMPGPGGPGGPQSQPGGTPPVGPPGQPKPNGAPAPAPGGSIQ